MRRSTGTESLDRALARTRPVPGARSCGLRPAAASRCEPDRASSCPQAARNGHRPHLHRRNAVGLLGLRVPRAPHGRQGARPCSASVPDTDSHSSHDAAACDPRSPKSCLACSATDSRRTAPFVASMVRLSHLKDFFHALLQTRSSRFEKSGLAVQYEKVGGPYTDVFISNCTKKLRKLLILLVGCLQLLSAKSVKSCVAFSTRTIYRWIRRFWLGGMKNQNGMPAFRTDQHAAWIRTTVGKPQPRSMPMRVRLVGRAASAPSLEGKVQQRPAAAPAPAAAAHYLVRARQHVALARSRVPQARSPLPGVGSPVRPRRRVRPGCAEHVRTPSGQPRAPLGRVASGRFRLHPLAASSPEGQL